MIETIIAITVAATLTCIGRTVHAHHTCTQAIEFVLKRKITTEKLKWYDWLMAPVYLVLGSFAIGSRTFTEKGRQVIADDCRDFMLREMKYSRDDLVMINRELKCYVYPALKVFNI